MFATFIPCLSFGLSRYLQPTKLNLRYPRTSKDIFGNLKKTKVIPGMSYTLNPLGLTGQQQPSGIGTLRLLLSRVGWAHLAPFRGGITVIHSSSFFPPDRPCRRGLPRPNSYSLVLRCGETHDPVPVQCTWYHY